MPKRISGVSSRLLECAKKEFLEKGFEKASMRTIASKAETSARAIYTRFPNKEGLFDAIVDPTIEEFLQLYINYSTNFWDKYKGMPNVTEVAPDSSIIYITMIDYVYDHKDEFLLAINCLNGKRYHELIEELTTLNTNHIVDFCSDRQTENEKVTLKVIHLLTHSFYTGLFEPIFHGFTKDEAHFYIKNLCKFFINGISGLDLS